MSAAELQCIRSIRTQDVEVTGDGDSVISKRGRNGTGEEERKQQNNQMENEEMNCSIMAESP